MAERFKFNCLLDYDKALNYVKMIAMMMFPESEVDQKEVQIMALVHISDEEGEFDYSDIIKIWEVIRLCQPAALTKS
jgi:hypothetical protein